MTEFVSLLESALQSDGSFACDMHESWRQGRTAYGGFTAALAHEAARRAAPELPPLRSVQLAFVGPVGATLKTRARLLRRGKSTAFVEASVLSDGEVALTGTFLFMADRDVPDVLDPGNAPQAPRPDDAAPAMRGRGPAYREHLEYRHAAAASERGQPEFLRWVRVRQRDGLDPISEQLLIGDALPAAIIGGYDVPPVVSSVTWNVNLIDPALVTTDGWWLVHTRVSSARGGVTVQPMAAWNSDGQAAQTGSQIVSYFPAKG